MRYWVILLVLGIFVCAGISVLHVTWAAKPSIEGSTAMSVEIADFSAARAYADAYRTSESRRELLAMVIIVPVVIVVFAGAMLAVQAASRNISRWHGGQIAMVAAACAAVVLVGWNMADAWFQELNEDMSSTIPFAVTLGIMLSGAIGGWLFLWKWFARAR